MATFTDGNTFESSTARYPTFRKVEADNSQGFAPPQNVTQGFAPQKDITQNNLFQQSQQTAENQLSGQVEGFDQQAQIARETAKAIQAQEAKAKRELLMQSGLRDSGAYIQQGLLQPEEDQRRQRLELERSLAANRGQLSMQQQQAGQQAAGNLLGLQSQQQLTQAQIASQEKQQQRQIASQEKLGFADLSVREKQLAQEGMQFTDRLNFDKWATERGYTDAERQRAWQSIESEKQRTSQEKIAFADLSVREKQLAQDGQQFTDKLSFDKYALEKGYTEAEKERVWQSIEAEKQRTSTEKIAFADLSVREKQLAQEGQQFTDKLSFDKYALESGYTEAEKERAWQSIEAEKQRASTEKIAFADLNLRERSLAQEGMQFESKLDFDKYALEAGFTEAEKERAWKGIQNEKELQSREKLGFAEIESMDRRQAAQFTWQTAERLSSQEYSTGERVSQQDYNTAMTELQNQQQIALQANDIASSEKIAEARNKLDLSMQLQGFTQQEKMVNLDSQLAEARANNDVTRQKAILGYQSELNFAEMEKQYGYDAAKMGIQKNIDIALQNNDNLNAMKMLETQQKFASEQAVLDRQIQWAQVNMQQAGLDYEMIMDQVENGNISADTAVSYVKNALKDSGVTVTPPDPDAMYNELERDFRVQQYQFAQTNPEYAQYDASGKFTGLSETGAKLFNEFLNKTYYGEDGKLSVGGVKIGDQTDPASPRVGNVSSSYADGPALYGPDSSEPMTSAQVQKVLRYADDPKNQNYAVYQELTASAPAMPTIAVNNATNRLGNVPKQGTMLNIGGRLVMVSKGDSYSKDGRNHDYFELMDVATGTKKVFTGLRSDDEAYATTDNFLNWANDIAGI